MKPKIVFYFFLFLFTALLVFSYSNHFDNGFYFDDHHTITNNTFIRDIANIPSFFTDIETFGTMPDNRAWRPMITSLNAIDYWWAGGFNARYFHYSIFFWYLIQGVVLFFLFKKLFIREIKFDWLSVIVLVGVAYYMQHTANAETINYIIMRSDSFSTLCVVVSLWWFILPFFRKYYLFLIPAVVGLAAKESALMVVPLWFIYVLLIEEDWSVVELRTAQGYKKIVNTFLKMLIPSVLLVSFFVFIRIHFMPSGKILFEQAHKPIYYFITQWYVIVCYIGNFILPLNLSVDKDFEIITTLFDQRVLFSLILLLCLLSLALYCTTQKKYRLIAFGIFWFFIALAPTSSIRPFGQIANDHRMFFPFIGLVLSLTWFCVLVLSKHWHKITNSFMLKTVVLVIPTLVIGLHAYGTYQRNKVWQNAENLWLDATLKAPDNGRVQMNYGLTQMNKGNYQVALEHFEKAVQLMPYWAYSNINMGILKNAMGFPNEAQAYYEKAIRYQPNNAESYYYYAMFLQQQGRIDQAVNYLQQGNQISPGHSGIVNLLETLQTNSKEENHVVDNKVIDVENVKLSHEDYLNQSLQYYYAGNFEKCIEACEKALEVKPDYAEAYNNICSAYNALKEWEKAAKACEKALKINPSFERARNNLLFAKSNTILNPFTKR